MRLPHWSNKKQFKHGTRSVPRAAEGSLPSGRCAAGEEPLVPSRVKGEMSQPSGSSGRLEKRFKYPGHKCACEHKARYSVPSAVQNIMFDMRTDAGGVPK